MKVSRLPLSPDVWRRIAPVVADSLYGSYDFANLWRSLGGRPVSWIIEDQDDVEGVLTGVELGKRPLKRLLAMPCGCYARLRVRALAAGIRNEVSIRLMREICRAGYLRVSLFDFYHSLLPAPGYRVGERITTLVNISQPDWEPPDKKLRQQIRKAEKEGIQVEPFDTTGCMAGHMSLVRLWERRTGNKGIFSPAFFDALAELAKRDRRVRWTWCERNREPVSSNIFLMEQDQALHWLAFLDPEFSFLQAGKYIPFAVARSLAREGVRFLNLGVTPSGAPGVENFKSKWGGEPYRYNCYSHRSLLGKLL